MSITTIDYEKEYDNRARVPEHPQIFARHAREAEGYRKSAALAQLGISYGATARQIVDFFPGKGAGASAPLAMFIHGGWWRTREPASFSQLAAGANANGIDFALAGYDLAPTVTIAEIVEQMRAACAMLWRNMHKRIMVIGNSAGAHLAACMVATDWATVAADLPGDLVPAAYGISGVYDLAPLTQISVNADLKLDDATARQLSPLYWSIPAGRIFDAIVGSLESSEFLRQSRIIADAWAKRGVKTRYEVIPGVDHFTIVDLLVDPNSAMTRRTVELAKQVAAMPL